MKFTLSCIVIVYVWVNCDSWPLKGKFIRVCLSLREVYELMIHLEGEDPISIV